jgi:hypothetical protein
MRYTDPYTLRSVADFIADIDVGTMVEQQAGNFKCFLPACNDKTRIYCTADRLVAGRIDVVQQQAAGWLGRSRRCRVLTS